MFYSLFDYPIRVKIATAILSNLAVIIVSYCFLMKPSLRELQYLKQSFNEKQSRFLLIKKHRLNKKAYAKALALLKQPFNINQFATQITLLIQKNNLRLIRVEPKNKNKLLLIAKGDFSSMMIFLNHVFHFPHLIMIPKLQIEKENGDLTLQCIIDVYHD